MVYLIRDGVVFHIGVSAVVLMVNREGSPFVANIAVSTDRACTHSIKRMVVVHGGKLDRDSCELKWARTTRRRYLGPVFDFAKAVPYSAKHRNQRQGDGKHLSLQRNIGMSNRSFLFLRETQCHCRLCIKGKKRLPRSYTMLWTTTT